MVSGMSDTLQQRAWDAVACVPDPEIPALTIADLGILREVAETPEGVEVVITPTYSGCPAMHAIELDIQAALARAGIAGRVRTVLSPAWTTDWLTADAHRKLTSCGIAPPAAGAVMCPHCGSRDIELLSAFGSTACKALYRCCACREPFDAFKCH
jgi:ring-1,2-phenylacetyl-CoA epoxidase subunit PaaD